MFYHMFCFTLYLLSLNLVLSVVFDISQPLPTLIIVNYGMLECCLFFEDPVILQPSINLAFTIAQKKQGKIPFLKDVYVYKEHIFAIRCKQRVYCGDKCKD